MPTSRNNPLPLVGPVTYYLPVRNGRPCTDGLDGELRLIVQAELRVVRGEFEGLDRFYAAIRKDGRNFLTAAGVALIGAVGADDPQLFDEVLADIAAFPSRYGTPEAEFAAEIVMTWLHGFLHAAVKCPPWLDRIDLSSVPGDWRRQVGYLSVRELARRGEKKAAEVLADALLGLDPARECRASAADIHLKLVRADICREEARMDESARLYRAVVESAKVRGIVLPFLGTAMGPKTALEHALGEGAPELLQKVKKLSNGYFRNLVKYHNRYTGDSVADKLTPREFYIACHLKRGFRYKEIAERLEVSQNRLHAIVKTVYATLNIGSSEEIGDLVW